MQPFSHASKVTKSILNPTRHSPQSFVSVLQYLHIADTYLTCQRRYNTSMDLVNNEEIPTRVLTSQVKICGVLPLGLDWRGRH